MWQKQFYDDQKCLQWIYKLHWKLWHQWTIKSHLNGAGQDYFTPSIGHQINTMAMKKLMPFPAKLPAVMLQYPTKSIPWLLMSWQYKEPGHQLQQYWPNAPRIFRVQHQRGWSMHKCDKHMQEYIICTTSSTYMQLYKHWQWWLGLVSPFGNVKLHQSCIKKKKKKSHHLPTFFVTEHLVE